MTASTPFTRNRNAITLSIFCAAAAVLSVMTVQQFVPLDKDILRRLVVAFGDNDSLLTAPELAINWLSPEGLYNLIGYLLVSSAAATIVVGLSGVGRAVATFSLFTLSLLYQWAIWHFLQAEAHPIGFVVALIVGFGAGFYLRTLENQRRREESHYYELKLRNKELLDTRLSLLKQDEVERRILAADLHDQVLNDLKQVAQRFDRFAREPDPENEQAIRKITNQVMVEIREVMDSLSPSVLEHLGLGAAVEDCLRRGSERANFKVRFKARVDTEELQCLSMVEQGLLYRLVQESITNICKHAGASTVRTTLDKEEGSLVIRISDDGKGMDPALARGDSRGMKYMRYRADLIGATIGWKAGENGKGTTVEIRLGLKEGESAEPEAQGL